MYYSGILINSLRLDHVYLETNKQAEPYSIASILDFRLVSERKCQKKNTKNDRCFFFFSSSI